LHYLTAFFIAAVLSLLLTPLALYVSVKGKVFDRPGLRKIHQKAMPCLGGAAVAVAVLITIWLIKSLWPGIFHGWAGKFTTITFGGLLILGVGLYDDLKNASVGLRLVFQFAAAGILIAGGFCVTILPSPLGGVFELGLFSIPFTALWIVFIINAINFIDGLDGLAAGISIIVAATIFVSAEASGEGLIGLPAIVTVGALLGFLPFNFHPARIFLGDSGATFIGFILAAMTTLGTMKSIATVALPRLSNDAARQDARGYADTVVRSLRLAWFDCWPALFGLAALRVPTASVAYFHGRFTAQDTVMVGWVLLAALGGMWAVAGVRTLGPAFYARQQVWIPVKVAAVSFVVNAVAGLSLMGPLGAPGLMLANSFAAICQFALLLFFLLRPRDEIAAAIRAALSKSLAQLARPFAAALLMGLCVLPVGFLDLWLQPGRYAEKIVVYGGTVGGGAVVYAVLAWLFGSEEVRLIWRKLRERLGR